MREELEEEEEGTALGEKSSSDGEVAVEKEVWMEMGTGMTGM